MVCQRGQKNIYTIQRKGLFPDKVTEGFNGFHTLTVDVTNKSTTVMSADELWNRGINEY